MQEIPIAVSYQFTKSHQELEKNPSFSSGGNKEFMDTLSQIQQAFANREEQEKKYQHENEELVGTEQHPLEMIDEEVKNETSMTNMINVSQMIPEFLLADTNINNNTTMVEQMVSKQLSKQTSILRTSLNNRTIDFNSEIEMKMGRMVEKVLDMMAIIMTNQNLEKHGPELLHVLQEWSSFKRFDIPYQTSSIALTPEQSKQMKLWLELVKRYEQRSESNVKNTYPLESKVTAKEIDKWIRKIIGEQWPVKQTDSYKKMTDVMTEHRQVGNSPNRIYQTINSSVSLPMSKVEQFVIHIDKNQGWQSVDIGKQMADKIQHLVKNHPFIMQPTGRGQLSFSFRPEHLGEMFLRFTQINGETAVKIIVSTQTAQQALESNIHQLKHMFSPHQVVIERQDFGLSSTQDLPHKEQDGHEHSQQEKQQEQDSNEQAHHRDEFEKQLEQFLLNEKV